MDSRLWEHIGRLVAAAWHLGGHRSLEGPRFRQGAGAQVSRATDRPRAAAVIDVSGTLSHHTCFRNGDIYVAGALSPMSPDRISRRVWVASTFRRAGISSRTLAARTVTSANVRSVDPSDLACVEEVSSNTRRTADLQFWWALEDSNLWPLPRQGSALPLS
jgi:hypothetical protein